MHARGEQDERESASQGVDLAGKGRGIQSDAKLDIFRWFKWPSIVERNFAIVYTVYATKVAQEIYNVLARVTHILCVFLFGFCYLDVPHIVINATLGVC